ncbi:MAG: ABC transporter ATP-binding protein [Selenomonadaceae bacterium]
MLKLMNIAYSYDKDHQVLRNIDFSVEKGEIMAIAGRNGSGKTTLTRIIIGLVLAKQGKIELDGEDVTSTKAYDMARKIGYVFQNPDRQLFANTVIEETMYASQQQPGCTKEKACIQAREALHDVGLEGVENKSPQLLSRGEKQRLAIASALAAKPEILLLDEPTSGQDCRERTHLLRLIRRLNHEGMTIILVTHDMDIIEEHANHIIVLKDGLLGFNGIPTDLFSDEELTVSLGLELPETISMSKEMGIPLCRSAAEIYENLKRRPGTHA